MQLDYNISYEVCGVVICLIILFILHTQYTDTEHSGRLYRRMVWCIFAANLLDVITAVTITWCAVVPVWLNVGLNTIYYAIMPLCIFTGIAYVIYSLGKNNRIIEYISAVLLLMYFVLLAVNIPTGLVFSVDSQSYEHGPLFIVPYVLVVIFCGMVFAQLIISRRELTKRQMLASYGYIFITAFCSLLHALVFPRMLLDYFGAALAALFMLFTLETPDFKQLQYLQNNLRDEVTRQTKISAERSQKLEQLSRQVVDALIMTVDAKDEYTNGHSTRVSEYAELLARELHWPEDEVNALKYAALLHDIGKVGVPDAVLNKAGSLTDEEYAVIRQHPVIGAEILVNVTELPWAEEVARHHHERYDGHGYPDGLKGEYIPRTARLVCIADAYDAMSSSRIYRSNLSPEEIRRELIAGRGTQFDPQMLDVFLRMFDENRLQIEHPYVAPTWTDNIGPGDNEIDPLSGVLRRGDGERIVRKRIAENKGYLICMDVDNFAAYNREHGHPAGDALLRSLGEILRGEDSVQNTIFRFGGDEFVVYTPVADDAHIRDVFRRMSMRFSEQYPDMSVSAGACGVSPGDDYATVFSRADKALYYMKMTGKSNIFLYDDTEKEERQGVNDLEILLRRETVDENEHIRSEIGQFARRSNFKNSNRIVMITMQEKETVRADEIEQAVFCMDNAIHTMLRRSDLCLRYSNMQFVLLLRSVNDEESRIILERIFSRYYREVGVKGVVPSYSLEKLQDFAEP